MTKVYGIKNCDTVKKAMKWLESHNIEYEFIDLKTFKLTKAFIQKWEKSVGWETLLNRRGMMWRKVDDKTKESIDKESALGLMLETPTIIKRPVLEHQGKIYVSFKDELYNEIFK